MGLYGCRSGVVCTKLPLFYSPVWCSECAFDLIEDKGDRSSTSSEPIGNNLCKPFFLPRNLFGQDGAEVRTTSL